MKKIKPTIMHGIYNKPQKKKPKKMAKLKKITKKMSESRTYRAT